MFPFTLTNPHPLATSRNSSKHLSWKCSCRSWLVKSALRMAKYLPSGRKVTTSSWTGFNKRTINVSGKENFDVVLVVVGSCSRIEGTSGVTVAAVYDDDDVPPSRSNSCVAPNVGVMGFESIGGDPTNELVSEVSVSAKSPSWLVAAWINADSPLYAVDILDVICDASVDMVVRCCRLVDGSVRSFDQSINQSIDAPCSVVLCCALHCSKFFSLDGSQEARSSR
mmetsp:Transcript_13422/g.37777  ORF Transcript_13422/g.37777 Transcript_13422/m.37777 type:complete len:224 (-) Transcript_13422:155-826(-)